MISQRKAGAVLSYVSLLINAIVSFIYVPILLGSMTTAEYGVYELIGSIIAYLSVMDMGLSTTLSRYYVSTKVTKTKEELGNLLFTAKIIYGALTLLAVVVCVALYFGINPLFSSSLTGAEIDLAQQMMILVTLNCLFVLPGNYYLAIINANEKFVFARSLSIGKYLLQVIVVVCILQYGAGAIGVLTVQVLFNLFIIICYAVYVKISIREKAHISKIDGNLLRSLFSFSFFILLNMVFDQVFWKTGQVILGIVGGAVQVAIYGIACKIITSAYMQVSTGVTSVFLPKLTAISAVSDDMVEINQLFIRIGRIQAILVWGVCAAFVALGSQFIQLWAGASFSEAYPAVIILMICLSISLVQNLGLSILQAKNKLGFRSVVYVCLAVLDILISIPVSKEYGVIGCALVAGILLLIGTGPIINTYYRKVIGIDISNFWKTVSPLLVPAAVSSLFVIVANVLLRVDVSWATFCCESLVFAIVYFALLRVFFLNDYEVGLIRSIVNKIKRRA